MIDARLIERQPLLLAVERHITTVRCGDGLEINAEARPLHLEIGQMRFDGRRQAFGGHAPPPRKHHRHPTNPAQMRFLQGLQFVRSGLAVLKRSQFYFGSFRGGQQAGHVALVIFAFQVADRLKPSLHRIQSVRVILQRVQIILNLGRDLVKLITESLHVGQRFGAGLVQSRQLGYGMLDTAEQIDHRRTLIIGRRQQGDGLAGETTQLFRIRQSDTLDAQGFLIVGLQARRRDLLRLELEHGHALCQVSLAAA